MTKYMKRAGIDFSIRYRELNQGIKDVCIEKVNILFIIIAKIHKIPKINSKFFSLKKDMLQTRNFQTLKMILLLK